MCETDTPPRADIALDWITKIILRDRLGVAFTCEKSAGHVKLEHNSKSLIVNQSFFANAEKNWLNELTLPAIPLPIWCVEELPVASRLIDKHVPVLFGNPGFRLDAQGNGQLNLDVFGSAFFMLSRYEEAVVKVRDGHDRFPTSASIAYKAGFLDRPLVDEYVEILWAAMRRVWPNIERKPSTFRTLVSHDVDRPSRFAFRRPLQAFKECTKELLLKGHLGQAIRGPWTQIRSRSRLQLQDPYNTFDWLMDISEKRSLTSAFYFLCGRTNPAFDADYEIEHPSIRRLMNRIHDRGHEIGLHPSYGTYRHPERIVKEAKRLSTVCKEENIYQDRWGGRMHYLRWETPTTLYGWEKAGMTYDSTLGYADCAGFRCGTCHEYPAFDPVAGKPLNLRIRPLVAMEAAVMNETSMELGTGETPLQEILKLKNACRIARGDFTFLWHNSRFTREAERKLYQAVLDE